MRVVTVFTIILFLFCSLTAIADSNRVLRSTGQQFDYSVPFSADESDTLSYVNMASLNESHVFWTMPNPWGDRYLNVRFTSPYDRFRLIKAHIPLCSIPEEMGGPMGEPTMRVIVWDSGEFADMPGYPAEVRDSIDIPNEDLQLTVDDNLRFNVIDFDIYFQDIDFHIGVDVVQIDSTDTLAIYSDLVNGENRSKYWDVSGDVPQWRETHYISVPDEQYYFNYAIWAVVTDQFGVPAILEPDGTVRSILIDPAYPNPFNHQVNVHFTVKPGLPFTAILFDNQGRELQLIDKGIGGVGERNLTIAGNGLAAGTYYLRVFAGNTSVSQRLIYLK
ncbi:MAG: T9SS type A sorting domain-containing protein [Calditrichaeota bacterium]|nr:T9SS type A sorting domain-containing protein [Calditrichota bacterium]